ncbi:sialate O-acetylesterase [Mucisphaera calidilacus]|uniref:Sialate O-acetylesterase domain-containing protein n=1 Tax=Mucisphaera calidilacus TaxID=2527982 RepID=A0A518BUY4_9BACT|nr:sialate O-acetylesterase [Mucisphaera calidilacus]QDU70744.1 hypothetical protein Pan265_05790 [Mucisphaera calidilacus]
MTLRALLILCACCVTATAEITLPALFDDHMVLQQGKPLAVWGRADPRAQVTIEIDTQRVTATTAEDGTWSATLEPLEAGSGYMLRVSADGQSVLFEDVLVGEVWLCSGQSNMDMRMDKMDPSEIEAADHPEIRLFRVERSAVVKPARDVDADWEVCTPENVRDFSAAAYYMGRELQQHLDVPVGLIHTAYGGTAAEAWTRRQVLEANPILVSLVERYERLKADPNATPPEARRIPGGLYNGMIHPLVPYTIRGFAWYQGESNTWRAAQYKTLLEEMIIDWRTQWGDLRLPFAIVQLPGYVNPPRVPAGIYSWEELREAQSRVAYTLPSAGLIVTIDVGDPTDIHPLDKHTVGKRLANWALHTLYEKEIYGLSPRFWEADFRKDSNEVHLKFENVGTGLTTRDGGPVRGFVIAGDDRRFRWAKARIEGDVVIVSEAKVKQPRAVRYAWNENPDWANLVNNEGLPASPFRTDRWPGITDKAR